ncbi:glycosyltransferase [Aureimonas sp. ME7]|uniref:glycosyltransferase n=1 Tax=Aureimonas sp. ME7 TaxID=2744252 RepID=UPI0015F69884|nr:glycosyltransferase [Aureimonas sp. ME7]
MSLARTTEIVEPQPMGGRLLLVTAVRLRRGAQGLEIDDQTAAGLERWAEHFAAVTYAGILLKGEREENTTANWVPVRRIPGAERMRFLALPMAYRIGAFARTYRATRRQLGREIAAADHLCFTLGYLAGDWGAVAALEARAQDRRHAVWFDRVEHETIARTLHAMPWKRRLKERASIALMKPYHRRLIAGSSLGLFQGMDTFDAYAAGCANPACVYDVHTRPADFIGEAAIAAKIERLASGAPVRILYAGRAAEMKGPIDWLEALAEAHAQGLDFRARWLGDGPMLGAMREAVERLGLGPHVELAGFVSDRETVLQAMREADIFLFCHKTPESPRCLVEALVSACPLVGYESRYASGLVEGSGGALPVPPNDPQALGRALAGLASDRERLGTLVRQAAVSGRRFDEAKLYAERAGLIAAHA